MNANFFPWLRPHPGRLREAYGPWAVVTGASDGIGRAFAHALAAAGLNLVLVARHGPPLAELAESLQARHGIEARTMALDLSGPGSTGALASWCEGLEVGLLVAAAGFGAGGPFLAIDPVEQAAMVNLNCRSTMELAHAFGQSMAVRGRGGVVLFGSIVGFQGVPLSANYAATKAYVQSLAEALHLEWKPIGIDVLSVAPGPVASGFAARAGLRYGAAVPAAKVAAAALRALGRGATVRPGLLSWGLAAALAPLPRPWRVRVMGRVMAGMAAGPRQEA